MNWKLCLADFLKVSKQTPQLLVFLTIRQDRNRALNRRDSCIRECFVGNYRVNNDSGSHFPSQDQVDARCLSFDCAHRKSAKLTWPRFFTAVRISSPKVSVFFGALLAALALGGVMGLARAPYLTNQNVTREQPIQFSTSIHVETTASIVVIAIPAWKPPLPQECRPPNMHE